MADILSDTGCFLGYICHQPNGSLIFESAVSVGIVYRRIRGSSCCPFLFWPFSNADRLTIQGMQEKTDQLTG